MASPQIAEFFNKEGQTAFHPQPIASALAGQDEEGVSEDNFLLNLLKGRLLKAGTQEQIQQQSFDQFFTEKKPALHILGDALRASGASLLGQKFVSTREQIFEEFQQKQLDLDREKQRQAQEDQLKLSIGTLLETTKTRRIAQAEQVRQFEIQQGLREQMAGLDATIKQQTIDMNNAIKETEIKLTGLKVPQAELAIKNLQADLDAKTDKLKKFSGTEFEWGMNTLVRNKGLENVTNDDMLEITRKISAAKHIESRKEGLGVASLPIQQQLSLIREGQVSLADTKISTEAIAHAMNQKILLKDPGTGARPGTDAQMANYKANVRLFDFFKAATLEAGPIDFKDREGLASRLNSILGNLQGRVGHDAAANFLEAISAGITSRLARSVGGEVGVLTDRDVARFQKFLPLIGDTPDEIARKENFWRFEMTSGMVKIAESLPQAGGRISPRLDIRPIKYSEIPAQAEKFNMEIDEFIISAKEAGYRLEP